MEYPVWPPRFFITGPDKLQDFVAPLSPDPEKKRATPEAALFPYAYFFA
jgi:hypothetical protein